MTLLTLFAGVGGAAPPVGFAFASCGDFTAELRKRRDDIGGIKHPLARYKEIVNQEVPPPKTTERLLSLFNKYSARKG